MGKNSIPHILTSPTCDLIIDPKLYHGFTPTILGFDHLIIEPKLFLSFTPTICRFKNQQLIYLLQGFGPTILWLYPLPAYTCHEDIKLLINFAQFYT